MPAPGSSRRRRPPTGQRLRTSTRQPVARARRPAATVDRRPGRVLARVGQPLLHDPVRRPRPVAVGHRPPRSATAIVQRRPAPRPPGTPRPARAGRRAWAAGAPAPRRRRSSARSTPITSRRSCSACVRAGPDHPGRPRDLRRRRVRAELQRPGVQAEQRDPVGQHVVHLPGDPGALQRAGPASTRSCCSASARSARSRSDSTSCRRARTNMPQASTIADEQHAPQPIVAQYGSVRVGPQDRRRAAIDRQVGADQRAPTGSGRCTGDGEQHDQQRRPPRPARTAASGRPTSGEPHRPAPAQPERHAAGEPPTAGVDRDQPATVPAVSANSESRSRPRRRRAAAPSRGRAGSRRVSTTQSRVDAARPRRPRRVGGQRPRQQPAGARVRRRCVTRPC